MKDYKTYLRYVKNIIGCQLEDNKNGLSIDKDNISSLLVETANILNHGIEEDTLICGDCGSDNISQMAKVNPNTLELDEFADEGLFDKPYYCNNEECKVETFDEATSYTKGAE